MILNAVVHFQEDQFKIHGPRFYKDFVDLLLQEPTSEIRTELHQFLVRMATHFPLA